MRNLERMNSTSSESSWIRVSEMSSVGSEGGMGLIPVEGPHPKTQMARIETFISFGVRGA